MAYFAKVLNGKVVSVIVAEQDYIDSMVDDSPGKWLETCKRTSGNVHKDDGTPLRYNFAEVGGNYDKDDDAFYSQKPHPSWILDTTTYLWNSPIAYPDDGEMYLWNEETQTWDAVESE